MYFIVLCLITKHNIVQKFIAYRDKIHILPLSAPGPGPLF